MPKEINTAGLIIQDEFLTVEEFEIELSKNINPFITNMIQLKLKPMSFPEWYELFGGWLDIGTDMEPMCWGNRKK